MREATFECPVCFREAPWTDGQLAADGYDVDEFWCQTCGHETPLSATEAARLRGDLPTSPDPRDKEGVRDAG